MLPHRLRRNPVLVFAASLLAVGLVPLVSAAPAGASHRGRVVSAGQSIQAAIDAARPGERIVVRAGTYAEQLTVTKDGITLVGDGAVLVPPASASTNTCTGLAGPSFAGPPSEAGICVTGSGVGLAPFVVEHRKLESVARRIRDVTVAGFDVRGFSGPNVAVVGGSNTRIVENRLADGEQYGALSVGSRHTRISGNTVTAAFAIIGVCVDDVSPALVSHNDVSGYFVGLCVQTQGARIHDNRVHGNCVGVYVDPGIGASVRDNDISANNGGCLDFGFPTGIGVFLDGTAGTEVKHNRITGHTPAEFGAGLVLMDHDGGPLATDNEVKHNKFADNTLDLLVLSAGSGNEVEHNRCSTSEPDGFCEVHHHGHRHGQHRHRR